MLNWIPALFLLLMHGAVAPEGAARDARLPLGAVAFVQAAAHGRTQGPSLSATLRMIARYAAQVEPTASEPLEVEPVRAAPAPKLEQHALPEDVLLTSSRTRDGPSVV